MAVALNFDILVEIIPYLTPRDALALGTACHVLRHSATRHAVSNVRFSSATRLTQFCQFVLAEPDTRTPVLRSLTLLQGITKEPRSFYATLEHLAKLLPYASELDTLVLPSADLLLTIEPSLGEAIMALQKLSSLTLQSFGNDTEAMLLQLQSARTLRSLHVAEEWTIYTDQPAHAMVLPEMLNLHTLVLSRIQSPPSRHALLAAAPGLRSLQLNKVIFNEGDPALSRAAWWPSLDHLRGDLRSLLSLHVPRPVRALEVDIMLDRQRDWDPAPLCSVLAAASPQRLTIGMQAGFNQYSFWKTYAPAMPRVRYLELVVADTDPASPDLETWLDNMSYTGSPALLALAIHIQRPPVDPLVSPPLPVPSPIDSQLSDRLRSALPPVLPSLRLLALNIGIRSTSSMRSEPRAADGGCPAAAFDGAHFEWWYRESDDQPVRGLRGEHRVSDCLARPWSENASRDAVTHDADRGVSSSCDWQRVAGDKGARLFGALRETDFEAVRGQEVSALLRALV